MELRNTLVSQFGVELPATATFDYPTASALAGFIATQVTAQPSTESRAVASDGEGKEAVFGEETPLPAGSTAVDTASIRCA